MAHRYKSGYTVHHIVPGQNIPDQSHKAKRGATRASDMSPAEVKEIVIKVAQGCPNKMSDITGFPPKYFVDTIKGHRVSWARCDAIRATLNHEGTMTQTTTTGLHPLLQEAVDKGKIHIANCEHCKVPFIKDHNQRRYHSPECKKAANAAKPKKKVSSIHTKSLIECAGPGCTKKFRKVNGKKYHSRRCLRDAENERKRANYDSIRERCPLCLRVYNCLCKKTGLPPTPAPEPKQKAPEPKQEPKQEAIPQVRYLYREGGDPCHLNCGGTLQVKHGRNGAFLGCSNYKKTKDGCRGTAEYIELDEVAIKRIVDRHAPKAKPEKFSDRHETLRALWAEIRALREDVKATRESQRQILNIVENNAKTLVKNSHEINCLVDSSTIMDSQLGKLVSEWEG